MKKIFIFILVMELGIGFALLSSEMSINGLANVKGNTWDVYFENIQVTEGSVEAESPIITNKTTISCAPYLNTPGDFYEFTVDVVNNGTIDAVLQSIINTELSEENSKLLEYTMSYEDGKEIKENDTLNSEDIKTYKITIKYKDNINASDLKDMDTNVSLALTANYVQSSIKRNIEAWDFAYKGNEESFEVPYTGRYKIEVWGAQGGYGSSTTYRGGYGGYSIGYIDLEKDTTIYINVGGKGVDGTTNTTALKSGGYNGGGSSAGTTGKYVGSGGGATHIALESGLLSTFKDKQNKLLIVAGGGGAGGYESSSYTSTGGNGGGFQGTAAISTNSSYVNGKGGTQTSGGTGQKTASFGQGANATSDSMGGGGGYYGGGAGQFTSGGGGGSGYIGNSLLTKKAMYCYNCSEPSQNNENYRNIKTISITNVSSDPKSRYAKIGNGYAKITYLGE